MMHVLDLGGIDLRALDGGLHHVAAQRRAVGHVEGAAPALGEAGAGGGDDDGFSHGELRSIERLAFGGELREQGGGLPERVAGLRAIALHGALDVGSPTMSA